MFENLLAPVALTDLVSVVHYTLRNLKHRQDMSPRLRASALKGLKADPSPEVKKLGQRLLKEIEKHEGKPIEQLSEACVADYVRALADIVDRRMEAELHFDRERGERILEKLRDH